MRKKGVSNFDRWILLIGSIAIAIYLIKTSLITQIISSMGDLQIIGVLISGFLFGFFFSIVPATIALIYFANSMNPFMVAFIAAIGTMIGNILVFKLIRDELPDEIEEIVEEIHLEKIRKSKFKWIIPGIAGFIIISPLPDELGISLLGASKFKTSTFMLISFVLSFIGILIITSITRMF